MKRLLVGQSIPIPEDLIPFENLSILLNQYLLMFNEKISFIFINSNKITSTNFDLSSAKEKKGKLEFTIPKIINQLIIYIKSFGFTIASYLYIK